LAADFDADYYVFSYTFARFFLPYVFGWPFGLIGPVPTSKYRGLLR